MDIKILYTIVCYQGAPGAQNRSRPEKLKPIVISSFSILERDQSGHLSQPYLGNRVYGRTSYDCIDAEINCEFFTYVGEKYVIEDCMETYLSDIRSWFEEQGRDVPTGSGTASGPIHKS